MATAADYMSLVLKGTRHGLLASIREDAEWSLVLAELGEIAVSGRGFFTDASLTFDFGWRELSQQQFDQIIECLDRQGLTCNGILSTSLNTRTAAEERGYRAIIGRLGLAKHHGRRMRREQEEIELPTASIQDASVIQPQPAALSIGSPGAEISATPAEAVEVSTNAEDVASLAEGAVLPTQTMESPIQAELPNAPGEESAEISVTPPSQELSLELSPSQEGIHVPRFQDEEPTLYLRKTLRGGQRVVFAGNVVLLGDLNPGAAIEADGDIIVLGQLRGSVHAGAEGDRNATVVTSSLRATQLRIADHFWQSEKNNSIFKKSTLTGTLRARLDGNSVVVEALPVR